MTAQEFIDEVLPRPEDYGPVASKLARMLKVAIEQRDNAIRIAYTELRRDPATHFQYSDTELDRIAEGE